MARSYLEVALDEFTSALTPLEGKLTAESFPMFMLELGWDWPGDTTINFGDVVSNITNLKQSYSAIDFDQPFTGQISKYTDLTMKIKDLVVTIYNMASSFPSQLPSTIPAHADFAGKIGIQVFDYLVCTYLKHYRPLIFGVLRVPGIIEYKESPYTASPLADKVYTLNWDHVAGTVSDFAGRMKEEYKWADPAEELDHDKLLGNIEELLTLCGIPAGQRPVNDQVGEKLFYAPGQSPDYSVWETKNELNIPVYEVSDPDMGFMETGINILPVPDRNSNDKKIAGFALEPYMDGTMSLEFDLTENLKLTLSGGADAGITITVIPGKVDLLTDLFGTGVPFTGDFKIELVQESSADKIVVIGNPGESRLEYEKFSAMLQLILKNGYDLVFETEINGTSLVIQASEGDGLLQKILPSDPIAIDFDFGIGLSRSKGIYFKGGAGLEFSIPVNETLGPITIISIDFRIEVGGQGISLVTAVSGKAEIGPVSAQVSKMGLKTMLELNKPGILGNSSIGFNFKPPGGVGLNLDANGVKGGGYLEIDDGNYAGTLYIDIQGTVTITVIGILTTRLPDGSKIFSLKILGYVEFPPIQLGMGFILQGIGICAAIECAMNTEALRNSVYSGSLNSLLFPPDPIKNAIKIITELKNFFPPKDGSHVFGVAVKMGWGGAKALVQAELGIFIQIGGPLRLALAGKLYVRLPDPDAEEDNILILQMQAIGIIDFGDSTVSIDAALTGSRILTWPIEGDMALRACWGDNKRFAFSVGGFYPGYKAPVGFPTNMRRFSISFGSDNPKISVSSYFAITENSLQFGAQLLFHYEKDVWLIGFFELDGRLSMDALIRFKPFYFETSMCAMLSLKRDGDELLGVDLGIFLSGPNNYHARGHAKFKICGIGVKVEFDKRFGRTLPDPDSRQVVSPYEMLLMELDNKNNWSIIKGWGAPGVVFKEGDAAEACVDTFGGMCFSQKSIPLQYKLQKFGQAEIKAGENYFDVDSAFSSPVEESFAPAQFVYLSDSQKISAPPFEKMKSGIELSSRKLAVPGEMYFRGKEIAFETKYQPIKESKDKEAIPTGASNPDSLSVWQKAAGKNFHTSVGVELPGADKDRITVGEQRYSVALPDGEKGMFTPAEGENGGVVCQNMSYAQARQRNDDSGNSKTEIMPSYRVKVN